MAIYLNSYIPLAITNKTIDPSVPAFIDASHRREPDFESRYPSITSICRGGNFAPRLKVDDIVVYMTNKSRYFQETSETRRLTAILKVLHRFKTHQEAADWYHKHDLPIPRNCMIPTNVVPLPDPGDPSCGLQHDREEKYLERAATWGTFLVCIPLYLELHTPLSIPDDLLISIFGKIPGRQNPGKRTEADYLALLSGMGISLLESDGKL